MGGPVGVVMAALRRIPEDFPVVPGLGRSIFEKRSRSADLVEEFKKLRDVLCVMC
jgi:hypothetical protein